MTIVKPCLSILDAQDLYFMSYGGVKAEVSVAFGITLTRSGAILARSTVFSREVLLTQITWSTVRRLHCNILLMWIDAASAKPKSEWSVKQLLMPMVPAWNMLSWHKLEVVWWPCTMLIRYRIKMARTSGNAVSHVGSVTEPGGSLAAKMGK